MHEPPRSVRLVLQTGRLAGVTARGSVRFAVSVLRGLWEHDAFDAASSIAFWLFLSLIPALVFAGFAVGQLVGAAGVEPMVGVVLDLAPGASSGVLRYELDRLASVGKDSVGPLSVLGFLWTSSSGLHNAMDAFEVIVRVPRRRPWWQQRLMAVGWVLGLLVIVIMFAWLTYKLTAAGVGSPSPGPLAAIPSATPSVEPPLEFTAASFTREALRARLAHLFHISPGKVALGVILFGVSTATLAAFFRLSVVHPKNVRRRAWPGALASMLTFLLITWAFGKFVINLNDYTIYYGSLAAVATLLIWLYLTSLTLLIGVEVNARLEGLRGSFHELFGES